MKKIILGRTGIEVSELCFGALPLGPLQKNMGVEEGAEVIAHAFRSGVNFVDTAQMYRTYGHVRRAIEISGVKPVISTKSHVNTYEEMDASVKQAQHEMNLEQIDIFLLHAPRVGTDVWKLKEGAFRCLLDYREKGVIKAVGISCHTVDVIAMAGRMDEVDIVFPIINKTGMGILGGSRADMEKSIDVCLDNNKGVYFMKALAGGNLIKDYKEAMEYAINFSNGRAPLVIGMTENAEVDMNIACMEGRDVAEQAEALKDTPNKVIYVFKDLCKACGKCIKTCHSAAISMNGKAHIDSEKCLKCGYCVQACPEFAIRMI